ncbi:binary toxin-like calcium binding domain-containing protein [Bacillus thuringiensis]|uniref:binary toxin-like calcium binding domain-containing protein n=1 Tax=Bacillus thuringiensis TaxID=1428 RepID=UPI0015CF22D3|nr:binary toxin-like calcium binding domain-containing protein [Bacillus thuringiensis]
MKKKLISVTSLLLSLNLLGGGSIKGLAQEDIASDSKTVNKSNNKTKKEEQTRNGLLGYFYKKENFINPILVGPSLGEGLSFEQNDVLVPSKQTYQSFKWMGYIVSNETVDVTLKLSTIKNVRIEVENKIVTEDNSLEIVHLEKGRPISINIEAIANEQLILSDLKKIHLISVDKNGNEKIIGNDQLRNPQFGDARWKEKIKTSSTSNLFGIKDSREELIDTDGDGIYDQWEINGYTIQNKKVVEWKDEFAEQGYTKFLSNPLESHTVGDPYTDYEKASKDVPIANSKETFNPMVAAFPSVNVNLEKTVLSKNQDLTESAGSTHSTNWSYTNTVGVEASFGLEGKIPFFSISPNYSHSTTTGNEWGHSTESTSGLNTAETGYLNANIRYNNVGTGAIYEVKPTTSLVLDGSTLVTIKAQDNLTALGLEPKASYPAKNQNGIALNTMDETNSRPIPLNKEQLNTYLKNEAPLLLETNQVEGKYAEKDENGNIIIQNSWNGVTHQIENRTASIIVGVNDKVSEKKVAGKNYSDPEDKTPSISLKEALKLAYTDEVRETEGLLYYEDIPFYDEAIQIFTDEYTAKRINQQLSDTTGPFKDVNKLSQVKLEPKMNFTIKPSVYYDGAETVNNYWSNSSIVNGGNTGKKEYKGAGKSTYHFTDRDKEKFEKNKTYFLSMYVKSDANKPVTVRVLGSGGIIEEKTVTADSSSFQRINLRVSNAQSELTGIEIEGSEENNFYWDDIALVDVSAMNVFFLTDQEIKNLYQFSSSVHSTNPGRLTQLNFWNVPSNIYEYIKKYKIVGQHDISWWEKPEGDKINETRNRDEIANYGEIGESYLELDISRFGKNGVLKEYGIDLYGVTSDNREILIRSFWAGRP